MLTGEGKQCVYDRIVQSSKTRFSPFPPPRLPVNFHVPRGRRVVIAAAWLPRSPPAPIAGCSRQRCLSAPLFPRFPRSTARALQPGSGVPAYHDGGERHLRCAESPEPPSWSPALPSHRVSASPSAGRTGGETDVPARRSLPRRAEDARIYGASASFCV